MSISTSYKQPLKCSMACTTAPQTTGKMKQQHQISSLGRKCCAHLISHSFFQYLACNISKITSKSFNQSNIDSELHVQVVVLKLTVLQGRFYSFCSHHDNCNNQSSNTDEVNLIWKQVLDPSVAILQSKNKNKKINRQNFEFELVRKRRKVKESATNSNEHQHKPWDKKKHKHQTQLSAGILDKNSLEHQVLIVLNSFINIILSKMWVNK